MTADSKSSDHDQGPANQFSIIVNGEEKVAPSREISFEQVVSLAYDGKPPQGPNWTFTVTFRRGEDSNREGTLVAGQTVKVKKGMVFNVTATDQS
jgi:hypothetical protein